MSNANTDHSRALRKKSAAAYQKTLTAANRLEIRNKDAAKIQAIKDKLALIDGKDNAEKLILALDNYLKSKK
ncbi:hypothetical protein [Neisseria chenwenguii]|uniref:Uncharacterized protein n=1 Tax=Neisseria chenwenguii TaxID=1853278 RepID=A0A220S387_9NEIS|nr:hypothetical protein [Neisseria chenwenguii]ASK27887.1 hypothetical protein BG910_09215 [Neisseria chenwenguii]ROV56258.1 hypothetical protein EGS38_05945 [Neisseria chenwenguii]